MIKVNIQYPNDANGYFDDRYYIEKHLPMALSKLGPSVKGLTVEKGISGASPESEPPYIIMCSMLFDSVDDFYSAFLPHADSLREDFSNYTNLDPLVQISEVKEVLVGR